MKKCFQPILDQLEPLKKGLAFKMFDKVFAYACKFGYEGDSEEDAQLLDTESLFQRDEPQIEGLDLAGDLINILNGED